MIDFEFEPGKPPKGLELDKLCPDQDRWLIGEDPEATRREDPDSVRKQQPLSERPPLAGETWKNLVRQASEILPPGSTSDYVLHPQMGESLPRQMYEYVAPHEHQGLAGVTDDYNARCDRLKQLREDYDISFDWLWYRPYAKSSAQHVVVERGNLGQPQPGQRVHRRLLDLAAVRLTKDQSAGPSTEMSLFDQLCTVYSLPPEDNHDSTVIGLRFTVLRNRGVGVATIWVSYQEPFSNPYYAKRQAEFWQLEWSRTLSAYFDLTAQDRPPSERVYPLVIVCVDAPDLTEFCRDHASDVALWYTGGYEYESVQRQLELVGSHNNMSQRSYERLFMRWTEALALYNVPLDDPEAEERYRRTRCRVAQLFEHCILTRRIFRTDSEQISDFSTKVRFFRSLPLLSPNWSKANQVLSAFSRAEYEMVLDPPVQSVEAEELVGKALERFGISTLAHDTRRGYDLLDRRLQWLRGQWLAVFAVLAFLITALIDLLKK